MPLGQLKQILQTKAQFTIKAPFIVDFNAIVVSQAGKVQYYILYPVGTTLTDSDSIEALLTDNSNYRTAKGIGAGIKLRQAETVYGDATLSYNTSNESREYVKFANQPVQNVRFQVRAPERNFAGIYSSPSKEFNTTKEFHESAVIRSVEIVCSPQICKKP
ncbi:hypothetical protein H6F90_25135 [Trichocoleus sp. FACHB-591]|nr:hypothetical protein [Trichocoleus sp. FACHB-591]